MRIALFRCCMTAMGLSQYETSADVVLAELGFEVVNLKEFGCCGYPLRNANLRAYLLSSARNLALAERNSLPMLTLCNCCYGSLKHAAHILAEDVTLRQSINSTLESEGLKYEASQEPKHFLQLLHDDLGIKNIKSRLKKTFKGLKIATHYGCHILRPSNIVQFDRAFSPTKLDLLVEATGAESIPWLSKLECCGSPLMGVNDELSMDLSEKKIGNAKKAGADFLCVACPYCQMQFDKVQQMLVSRRNSAAQVPSILYHQLLGLSLGLDAKALRIEANRLPISSIEDFF